MDYRDGSATNGGRDTSAPRQHKRTHIHPLSQWMFAYNLSCKNQNYDQKRLTAQECFSFLLYCLSSHIASVLFRDVSVPVPVLLLLFLPFVSSFFFFFFLFVLPSFACYAFCCFTSPLFAPVFVNVGATLNMSIHALNVPIAIDAINLKNFTP